MVKAPAVTAELRAMIEHLPGDLRGVRDRAMLLVGFAAALRRSELVALDHADVADTPEGLVVTLRRSKTDPEGADREIGVPYGSHPTTCPVRALPPWTELAGVVDGPLFLTVDRAGRLGDIRASDRCVARAVQRAAQGAGLDPARYAGHSLRAGLATSAARPRHHLRRRDQRTVRSGPDRPQIPPHPPPLHCIARRIPLHQQRRRHRRSVNPPGPGAKGLLRRRDRTLAPGTGALHDWA